MTEIIIPCHVTFYPTEESLTQIKEELSREDFSEDPLDLVQAYLELFGAEEFIATFCASVEFDAPFYNPGDSQK